MVSRSHHRSTKNALNPRRATFKRTTSRSPKTAASSTMTNTESTVPNPHETTAPLTSLNLSHCVKLNPLNYTSWHFQLTHILFGFSLLGFLDGSNPSPSPTLVNADNTETPNPAYYTWLKQDGLILGALMGTLSTTVQALIVRAQTSKEAWDVLARTYANPSRAHILQIKDRFDSITKATDQTITDYMNAIKACIDQLALMGKTLDPEDIVSKVLRGLDYNLYKPVMDTVRARDNPISFEALHEKLLQHELLLKQYPTSDIFQPTANSSYRQYSQNRTTLLAVSTRLPNLHPQPCLNTKTSKCEPATSFQMGVLYLSLYLIALGTGGLKSSVSGFGADQFDESDEKESASLACFFNRFFFFISTGSLLAVMALVYIQDEVNRSLAYGICSMSMLIAIFTFLWVAKRYRYKRSLGSLIAHILQVIVVAVKKRKMKIPVNIDILNENLSVVSRIYHTNQFRFLDKAAVIDEGDYVKNGILVRNPWKLCTVTSVEEVKVMIRLLPIWATTILFWTTYAQMLTFSVEQASTLKRSIGGFQIPAASLSVFIVLAVLFTLAVYDRMFIPMWKKWKGKSGLTNLQRIAVGLVLSTLGMTAAAFSEVKRRSVAREVGETPALPFSVFILVSQFLLVGAGEAFTYTGQLDFFTTQSPRGMKGLSTGLFLTTISVDFFASSFLVVVVQKITSRFNGEGWIGENINKGRLDYFYGILATLSLMNFGMYIVCAKWYNAQMHEPSRQTNNERSSPEQEC
ncbi:hypothetical protein KSS87_011938 [Heliosperma pusillum]|nr:hypothetical protein KSS87_011938 [Heliosperma pusillum]